MPIEDKRKQIHEKVTIIIIKKKERVKTNEIQSGKHRIILISKPLWSLWSN